MNLIIIDILTEAMQSAVSNPSKTYDAIRDASYARGIQDLTQVPALQTFADANGLSRPDKAAGWVIIEWAHGCSANDVRDAFAKAIEHARTPALIPTPRTG